MIAEPEIYDACDDNPYGCLRADVARTREAFFPLYRDMKVLSKPFRGESKHKPETTATEIAKLFKALVQQWFEETWFVSSTKRRIAHPAYLKIIGLGPVAIPLIINELRVAPDHWFEALEAITREDPAVGAETIDQMRAAWLAWADRHDY